MTKIKTTINLTEGDTKMLADLKKHFDATSTTEVIRRSIAQSSALCKMVDENGFLVISEEDGKQIKIKA